MAVIKFPQAQSIFSPIQYPHLLVNLIESIAIQQALQTSSRKIQSPFREMFQTSFAKHAHRWESIIQVCDVIVSVALTVLLHGTLLRVTRSANLALVTHWPIAYAENWTQLAKLTPASQIALIATASFAVLWALSPLLTYLRVPSWGEWQGGSLIELYTRARESWLKDLKEEIETSIHSTIDKVLRQNEPLSRMSSPGRLIPQFSKECASGKILNIRGYQMHLIFFPNSVSACVGKDKDTLYLIYRGEMGLSADQLKDLLGATYTYNNPATHHYSTPFSIVHMSEISEELKALAEASE